jgi:hypothetical protein
LLIEWSGFLFFLFSSPPYEISDILEYSSTYNISLLSSIPAPDLLFLIGDILDEFYPEAIPLNLPFTYVSYDTLD